MGYKIYSNITCPNRRCCVKYWLRFSLIRNLLNVKKILFTLKIDLFETPGNKNVGIIFSNYELFYLDQANSSSDSSQILILRFFIPRGSLPYSRSLSIFTLANWNPSSTQSSSRTSSVSLFSPPPFNHTYLKDWINQTKRQAKSIKFIIKQYTNHNTLWVKHTTHQKAVSLRAASPSKLGNAVNNNSICNTKYFEFLTKW